MRNIVNYIFPFGWIPRKLGIDQYCSLMTELIHRFSEKENHRSVSAVDASSVLVSVHFPQRAFSSNSWIEKCRCVQTDDKLNQTGADAWREEENPSFTLALYNSSTRDQWGKKRLPWVSLQNAPKADSFSNYFHIASKACLNFASARTLSVAHGRNFLLDGWNYRMHTGDSYNGFSCCRYDR